MRQNFEKLYLTNEEKDFVNLEAERHHLSKSAYLRYKVFGLGEDIPFKHTFAKILTELRKANVDERLYNSVRRAIRDVEKVE